ncbi:MAG: ribulose-phosphate 3-epimerase [Candidatus Omnitrophica bacterium]|nr:ribulose-phosphate 3-epimerase [Candidatus Omnitrophota bacterium]
MKIKVAPSILSANFACLEQEIRSVEKAGADLLHIDVMDGHFVPNITIGPLVVGHIRKVTSLPLDVHLMIEDPQKYLKPFIAAGSDMITVHIETVSLAQIKRINRILRTRRMKFGISLNPATPISKIRPLLGFIDFILVMSVYPGFAGQKFIPKAVSKIRKLRSVFSRDIAVDGGINEQSAGKAVQAGANILVSGSYIFGAKDRKKAIERIRDAG